MTCGFARLERWANDRFGELTRLGPEAVAWPNWSSTLSNSRSEVRGDL